MATLLEAVGGDTFGGLSGYRRPVAGNPTKVPTNLPAFRGNQNTPGQKVTAPTIKSSGNRNNRGTNQLIPYSRITTYDGREVGGRLPGDVVFMSAFAPNAMSIGGRSYNTSSGHDVFHYSRLTGLYGINQILANIGATNGDGKLMNLYVQTDPSKSVLDHWIEVPNLNEFRLDGIVLSDDQPGVNHGSSSNELGQLFNISVQGPTPINNGYVTVRGDTMMSRPKPTMSIPPIVIRSDEEEKVEDLFPERNKTLYRQPNEFAYSTQMFSRDVEPQDELFCALVATEHVADDASLALVAEHDRLAGSNAPPRSYAERAAAPSEEFEAFVRDNGEALTRALRARKVYTEAMIGFSAAGAAKAGAIYTFQYVLCTSARLIHIANSVGKYNLARNERQAADGTVEPIMPIDHNAMREKGRFTAEQLCDANWMARVVGAWRIGNVLDTKATQVPYFEGGPTETGNRLTVNVGVRWVGWRELRRLYTANPSGPQVGSDFADPWTQIVMGSKYDLAEAAKRVGAAVLEVPDRAVPTSRGRVLEMNPGPGKDDLLFFQWPAKPEVAAPAAAAAAAAAAGVGDAETAPVDAATGLRVAQDEYTGFKRKRGEVSELQAKRAKVLAELEENRKLLAALKGQDNRKKKAAAITPEVAKLEKQSADLLNKIKKAKFGAQVAETDEDHSELNELFANVRALGASVKALHAEVMDEAASAGAAPASAEPAPARVAATAAAAAAPSTVEAAFEDAEPLETDADVDMTAPAAPAAPALQTPAKKVRATSKTMTSSSVDRARQRVQRVERDSPARDSPVASPLVGGSPTRSPGSTGANVFSRRRSTPSPSPDRAMEDADADVPASPAASAAATGAAAGPAGDDAASDVEEMIEPKQKKTRVRPTSDVFSSALGMASGESSRSEPLNPAHRGGEKFRRRRRG